MDLNYCKCASFKEHKASGNMCPYSWRDKIKATQGKRTSEGYVPKPNEPVEVRGD